MKKYLLLSFIVFSFISTGFAQGNAKMKKKIYRENCQNKLPYRLLKPQYGDKNKNYPLVVFLHGAGERGSDNEAQLIHGVRVFTREEALRKFPCYLIAPQCPKGKRWVEVDWKLAKHKQPEKPSETLFLLKKLIDELETKYKIDTNRIYVVGLSMGGFGVWDLITRYPEKFAAATPVCGGGDESKAEMIKTPVWVFHGALDKLVRPERARNMVAALRKAGKEVKYTEYPTVGHNAWDFAFTEEEYLEWLFSKTK
ncbi:MAG: phospholipase [Bacteroidia bacterium]|nr:MAG: phospholipase [Bacteroidia bacterium]